MLNYIKESFNCIARNCINHSRSNMSNYISVIYIYPLNMHYMLSLVISKERLAYKKASIPSSPCIISTITIPQYTYVYIYMHINTYTYTYIYIHTYIHSYIHTLHYITLHYITLHYITLHYIHYITYIHICIYICIYIYVCVCPVNPIQSH